MSVGVESEPSSTGCAEVIFQTEETVGEVALVSHTGTIDHMIVGQARCAHRVVGVGTDSTSFDTASVVGANLEAASSFDGVVDLVASVAQETLILVLVAQLAVT